VSRDPGQLLVSRTTSRRNLPRGTLVAVDSQPALVFDIVASKLEVPMVRRGAVSRTALVNRLRVERSVPLVTLVAPAGYGKTTLLAQWAARDTRPFAWITLDERDNDPRVLLRHVAAAVHRIEPLDPGALDAAPAPGGSVWTALVPRLAAALTSFGRSFVFVLDDVHVLRAGDSADAVGVLADHLPEGSLLALGGRLPPQLRIARLRSAGRMLELGARELALTRREVQLLLRGAGLDLAEADAAELARRTEGWAAGLYLASLAARDGAGAGVGASAIGGDDRYLADYFRSECLAGVTPEQLAFLRRTSVLKTMCGPLCDSVLERTGSALELGALESSNLFLVPLDRHGESYRYHHLFRDLLRRELTEREPELAPVLERRAADWFEAHGDPESALGHAEEYGDTDRVARLLGEIALRLSSCGRTAEVERRLERFGDRARLEDYPAVAAHGAYVHALRGRSAEADRWLAAAELGARPRRRNAASRAVRATISVVRATMCRAGPEQMLGDAEAALADLPAESQWRPTALLARGAGHVLLGEDERADAVLADAAEAAELVGATETRAVALAERALIAAGHDDHAAAEALSSRARDLVDHHGLGGYSTSALELAESARAQLRHGRWADARAHLNSALHLTPSLTHALPWLAVQARLELARAYVTLRDAGGAGGLLSEVDDLLRLRPLMGVLAGQAADVRHQIDAMPQRARANGTGLTAAELRLLPLLTTHLSFREIGERLFVSRNTIKAQAISVYRKLGVTSRSDAIERAARLGLVDLASPLAADFTPRG
jgi:LuxR family transcriptional regulator, maltose regulon positive regulatory protein